jgi:hypothetical protein
MPAKRTNAAALTRRSFLKNASALAGISYASGHGIAFAEAASATRLTQVFPDLNHIYKWDLSNGDTWDPFWADDGDLYAFNCDGRGFGTEPRNLAFNKLSGSACVELAGSAVNSMDDYGKSGLRGPDGATWKACGQECIDGVFYAFVSRNTYGDESHDSWLRQTAVNCSLIKSADRGLTWTRTAKENYAQPMWPGPAFGAPFFVHYGQNGGRVARDGADRFVYASSTNGFWNDGDSYILGRVERSKLSALRSGDWTYYIGGDGALDASWSPQTADAHPILSATVHCSQGAICFIPALRLYLLVAWYNTEKMAKWFEPARMKYEFYQAAHPWGPWELVSSFDDSFIDGGHMYGPSLCARFQERVGSEVRITMFTSGCPFPDVPSSLYKMWEIPLILRTEPVPNSASIPGDDPRVVYQGAWHGGDEKLAALNTRTRYTSAVGSSAELQFHGTGIAFVTEKGAMCGSADIFLDGRHAATVDLESKNFPRISSVEAYSATGLSQGPHTLRIVNSGAGSVAVEALRVID